jgi:hypothetical protein
MRLLLVGLCLSAAPAFAGQISFPVSVPLECSQLAEREHVPTIIENQYQAAVARVKLARLSNSDPMVSQCKLAIARARSAMGK